MSVLETIAKIRRAYFQDRKPIKLIGRELRVSGTPAGATEVTYKRSVQPQPGIGSCREEFERMQQDTFAPRSTEISVREGLGTLFEDERYRNTSIFHG